MERIREIDFPEEMRKVRWERQLSAKQMGGILGISGEQVMRMERGLEIIPHEVFQSLEELTGRSWNEAEYRPIPVKEVEEQVKRNQLLYEELVENYAPDKVCKALEAVIHLMDYSFK